MYFPFLLVHHLHHYWFLTNLMPQPPTPEPTFVSGLKSPGGTLGLASRSLIHSSMFNLIGSLPCFTSTRYPEGSSLFELDLPMVPSLDLVCLSSNSTTYPRSTSQPLSSHKNFASLHDNGLPSVFLPKLDLYGTFLHELNLYSYLLSNSSSPTPSYMTSA